MLALLITGTPCIPKTTGERNRIQITSLKQEQRTVSVVREISGFRPEIDENCVGLGLLTLEDRTET
jgi:hypothetical protein